MKQFTKDFIRAFVLGVVIFIVITTINYWNGFSFKNSSQLLIWFLYNQLYALVLFFVNTYYFRFLLRIYGRDTFKPINLLKGAGGGILITLVSIFLIRAFLSVVAEGNSFSEFLQDEELTNYYFSLLISLAVTVVFYIIYYYKNIHEREITAHKIVAGAASAKFESLKNQLDPHFLFNSLNVLTSLIEENPEKATEFTTALSKVYRYVLEQKNKPLVTVREELHFAKLYMSLLAMRFEDSLVFSFPDELHIPDGKVVPLALQLLLENAVKHNQLTPQKQLVITIYEENGKLWVSNNLQAKKIMATGTGVGLENIKHRYKLLTSENMIIEKDESSFKVGLPIIEPEVNPEFSSEQYFEERRYESAKRRIQELKGFYIHLTVYLLAIPGFIFLNIISSPGFLWAFFPICGWGIGVSAHAMETFGYHPFFNRNWEKRKIEQYIVQQESKFQQEVSYRSAVKYVKKLKDFYTSAYAAGISLPLLAILNYFQNGFQNPWVIYAIIGWGVALITQAISLFPTFKIFGKQWEERKMKKFMEEEKEDHFKN